jgi:putative transposase
MKADMACIAKTSKFNIEQMEMDQDHLHLLINAMPTISAAQIVRKLKQESTIDIWRCFPKLLKKHFWKERTFWTDGYFVLSTG